MTVIVIIGILVVLLFPALNMVRSHTDKVRCSENLRQLYLGANSYIHQNGHWPQISTALIKGNLQTHAYDKAWIDALTPFGIPRAVWICPTVQRGLGGPDYTKPENTRIDYIAMPFDDKQMTPFRWPTSPWFAEKGDVHGNGNLIIFTDGSIKAAKEVRPSGTAE